jgi:hypothetical protein
LPQLLAWRVVKAPLKWSDCCAWCKGYPDQKPDPECADAEHHPDGTTLPAESGRLRATQHAGRWSTSEDDQRPDSKPEPHPDFDAAADKLLQPRKAPA